jgi:acetyl-CoA decarbonylase/synthase complex subunit gamma
MAHPRSPLKIYALLPKRNCGECGVETCMAFALKLMEGSAEPRECPYIEEPEKRSLNP